MNSHFLLVVDRSGSAQDAAEAIRGLGEWTTLDEETVIRGDAGIPDGIRVIVVPIRVVTRTRNNVQPHTSWIAYGHSEDIVRAFFLGAADYLVEPWVAAEVIARARRVRHGKGELAAHKLGRESSTVITGEGHTAVLTGMETALWGLLCQHAGRIVSRSTIAHVVGLRTDDSGRSRGVDMAVSRLRRALGSEGRRIETVRARGYRLRSE